MRRRLQKNGTNLQTEKDSVQETASAHKARKR